ncbi:hypothetical protein H311_01021, partial [Anncaliia algerae PRA109]
VCTICKRKMWKRKVNIDSVTFQCNFCSKSKKIYHYKNIFNSKLPMHKILYFLLYFSISLNIAQIQTFLQISEKSIISLILQLQKKIHQYLEENFVKIGGEGHVVQIDETCVFKRKYNIGRCQQQIWLFGCIDVQTKEFKIIKVANRNKKTLGKLIEKIIIPNSTVYSDCFSSYLSYFRNNSKFKHSTVNHSQNFVDPNTGTHTQNIESLWSKFKQFRRSKGYIKENI